MPKSRSPGFKSGSYWMISDLSGFAHRKEEMKKTWDGFWVHKSEWNPRQPQDFVRGRAENITPPSGELRPDNDGSEVDVTYDAATIQSPPSGDFDNSL